MASRSFNLLRVILPPVADQGPHLSALVLASDMAEILEFAVIPRAGKVGCSHVAWLSVLVREGAATGQEFVHIRSSIKQEPRNIICLYVIKLA